MGLDDRLVAPPGTMFSYSNTGYAILTALVEQLTGKSFSEAMNRTVFDTPGLESTDVCTPTLPHLAVG